MEGTAAVMREMMAVGDASFLTFTFVELVVLKPKPVNLDVFFTFL